MSEFGPILHYGRVENAIRDRVLKPWMDTYLVGAERDENVRVRSTVRPRNWQILDDLTVTPEKNMPVVYLVSGGETGEPQDDGEGKLWAPITLACVVALKDTTRDTTRVTTRRYAAAVATLVEHKLGAAGLGIRLTSRPRQMFDEGVSQPSGVSSRFIFGLAYVEFSASVDAIRYRRGGPDDPFPEPPRPNDPGAPPNPADPDHLSTNVTVELLD